jgi:hypothetical protein
MFNIVVLLLDCVRGGGQSPQAHATSLDTFCKNVHRCRWS